jgi:hypothetical protein
MHPTQPLTFDRAATAAWLRQPSGTDGLTRADSLGVGEEPFGLGLDGFLATINEVLTARPDGLHRRADITRVQLWRVTDGEVLAQRARITVLVNGTRLATGPQNINDVAERDQRGVAAALSVLAHITNQVCLLLDAHRRAHPGYPAAAHGDAKAPTAEPAPPAPTGTFTHEQVLNALNQAVDDILAAVHAGDEGLRDAMNLMVNATVAYRRGTAQDLQEAVEHSYGADYQTVLGWIEVAL